MKIFFLVNCKSNINEHEIAEWEKSVYYDICDSCRSYKEAFELCRNCGAVKGYKVGIFGKPGYTCACCNLCCTTDNSDEYVNKQLELQKIYDNAPSYVDINTRETKTTNLFDCTASCKPEYKPEHEVVNNDFSCGVLLESCIDFNESFLPLLDFCKFYQIKFTVDESNGVPDTPRHYVSNDRWIMFVNISLSGIVVEFGTNCEYEELLSVNDFDIKFNRFISCQRDRLNAPLFMKLIYNMVEFLSFKDKVLSKLECQVDDSLQVTCRHDKYHCTLVYVIDNGSDFTVSTILNPFMKYIIL